MILAGEASGDRLSADLVKEIRRLASGISLPCFFGLGGPCLKKAGVEILEDMTQHTIFGVSEVLYHYRKFKKIFDRALFQARSRLPDLIILVDFGGFNLRFAKAIRALQKSQKGPFMNWNPKIAYFIPPQVWASRSGRARTIAETIDLILSIFPFEKDWYEERFPQVSLQYVGDPMAAYFQKKPSFKLRNPSSPLHIAILPGSRRQEIRRHLPIILESIKLIEKSTDCLATIITPNSDLSVPYKHLSARNIFWETGNVAHHLQKADLAIASSGMVTRECAYLGVPSVVIYKLSWLNYQIAKRIIKVKFIAMPNILSGKMIFPELIQNEVTPKAIARSVFEICQVENRKKMIDELQSMIISSDSFDANKRAAKALANLIS